MTSVVSPADSGANALFDAVVSSPATVVEASAGTGKTYQLERLALELIADGRARVDELLVVTFTERATNELVMRVRRTIDEALAAWAGGSPAGDGSAGWQRGQRLAEARRSFDQACITTIHAFCHGLLMDEPLATGRLLGQTQVDSQAVFGEVFRDVLRTTLSTDAAFLPYLDGFLGAHGGVASLETLLYRAATTRGRWDARYDESRLAPLVTALAATDLRALERFWKPILGHANRIGALKRRLETLASAFAQAREDRNWPALLAVVDEATKDPFCEYVDEIAAARALGPQVDALGRGLVALVALPTLKEATIQLFLPPVRAELDRRKLARGLFDFDDMITAVAQALDGPSGGELIAKLRRRFRFALIDEAQDTDATQWRIFERIFLDSGGANPCVLIGDPKQAIYGFRGADVQSYVTARAEIAARQGAIFPLDRNFRSADEVVRAVNAILDQGAAAPFFTNPHIVYDHPVSSERGALGDGAGVILLELVPPQGASKPLRVGPIKLALRRAIAVEIARLRDERPDLRLSDIFVLTRTNVEAQEISAELDLRGIPQAFYKQEGLWRTTEADHIRVLLRAIDDPLDRIARMQACLTPFFGMTLRELETLGDPPQHHPVLGRLFGWKRLADARRYPALFAEILDGSGVTRRLLLGAASDRRLTLYRQLFDQLLADTAARPLSLGEVADLLGRYAAGQFPAGREGSTRDSDIQRADLDANAVQIVTMHKAKGLEAEFVFLYGALTNFPIRGDGVHQFYRDGERVFCVAKPRLADTTDLIKINRNEEDQRLLYVALTRARHRLYLPFFPATESDDTDLFTRENDRNDHGDYRAFDKITGPYRHVNDRLRHLATDAPRFRAMFVTRTVPFTTPTAPEDPAVVSALSAWAPAIPGPGRGDGELVGDVGRLRASRRGFVITSYSRLKDASGGYQPPVLDERGTAADDAVAAAAPPEAGAPHALDLPGGAATGLFLHAVLEKASLGPLPPLPDWERQPAVQRLLAAECRRWDRNPRHLPAAARAVHAALTTTIALPDGALAGIATARQVRREVDFLFPLAAGAGQLVPAPGIDEGRFGAERGFVRGVLDVVFEHEGKVYFADWKSDMLPSFAASELRAHVAANNELQIQIYTVALSRLLGVQSQEDWESRFGGLVYVFLRGLAVQATPDAGLDVRRPSYGELRAWEQRLVSDAGGGWT